jgi:hypothetical protein
MSLFEHIWVARFAATSCLAVQRPPTVDQARTLTDRILMLRTVAHIAWTITEDFNKIFFIHCTRPTANSLLIISVRNYLPR